MKIFIIFESQDFDIIIKESRKYIGRIESLIWEYEF